MLFLLDYWLDTIAAALGVIATLVGIHTAFRLMDHNRSALATEPVVSTPPGSGHEGAMAFSVAKPKPITSRAMAVEAQPSLVSVGSATAKETKSEALVAEILPPELHVDRLRHVGSDCLRLTLRNRGSTLSFQAFELGEFNEMEVTYTPPVYREKESFARGSALNFTLQSHQLERATYHFFVIFEDEAGQIYRQEVAGMGAEPPIIETPVRG